MLHVRQRQRRPTPEAKSGIGRPDTVAGCLGLLLVACAGAASPTRASTAREASVKQLRVNKVISVRYPDGNAAGEVVTDKSGALRLVRASDAESLAALARMNQLASIEYDPATLEVTAVGSSPRDVVMALSQGAAVVSVQLMKRPTLLTLDARNPRFDELMRVLEDAKTTRKAVHLGLLPGATQIEDVRAD